MDKYALGHAAWPILVELAGRRSTMFYGELAKRLGYSTARVSRAALWSIQDFCAEKDLPPLTSIVVNRRTGRPGTGFRLGHSTVDAAQERAFGFDWSSVSRPFPEGSRERLSRRPRKTAERAGKSPASYRVSDSEVTTNGRGPYQARFRDTLMSSYKRCCALCDTRHGDLLVASHIVPWAQDADNRLNPRNGILLCRTHDAAFEHGLISIQPDGRVTVSQLSIDKLGRDLHAHLRRTASRVRTVAPTSTPSPEFLAWRLSRATA